MPAYALHNEDCSNVIQRIEMSGGSPPVAPDGWFWTEVPVPAAEWSVAMGVDGSFVSARILKSAADVLADAKIERWAAARAYRDACQLSGCDVPGLGRFDTDADSQRKVGGAATAAMVAKQTGAPFEVNWTMADNAVVPLDADAMIGAGMAIVAHLAACQDAGTAVRAQIEAAPDAAALAAIDITAGYPS